MFKSRKTKTILISSIILLAAAVFCYVRYFVDKPLELLDNCAIPSEFTFNDEKIALAWTDDNTGETLIIQSDKKEYSGFNQTDTYFSITNISNRDQDADVVIWLEDGERSVESIERIKDGQNKLQITNYKSNPNDNPTTGGQNRKDIKGFTNGYTVKDSIKSGKTNYYKAILKFPPMSQGEFFIEVFSAQGGYGHLDPWYSSSWTYRKHIIIDHTKVAEDLAGFPTLVSTTDTDSISKARADGYDIVFTSLSGTKLNHEIEKYVPGTGELVAWVKTDLSSTADTVLYMYYGNASAADQQNITGVWDSNFVMVQHLKEDPSGTAPQMIDSTQYNNDGTSGGTMLTEDQVPGQVDGALDFDGTDDYVKVENNIALTNPSLCSWIKTNSVPTANQGIIGKYDSGVDKRVTQLVITSTVPVGRANFITSSNGLYQPGNSVFSTSLVNDNNWHFVCGVYDTTYNRIYVDGVLEASTDRTNDGIYSTSLLTVIGTQWVYGVDGQAANHINGLIDSTRISNTARTAGWITTEYNNQSDAGSFMTIGAEEDNTPTEFVSTIRASGGDYNTLSSWEDAVECDLTATTTRVFSGALTLGALTENDLVELYRGGVDQGIDGYVVATSVGGQILVDGITGATYDLVAQTGDIWRKDASNYWTIAGTTGNELGDTAIAVAECYNDWPTGLSDAVSINGWTTDSDNYIKIYAPSGQRHDGWTWTDATKTVYSGFALKDNRSSWSSSAMVHIYENDVVLDGLIVNGNNIHNIHGAINIQSTSLNNYIKNIIVLNSTGSTGASTGGAGVVFEDGYGGAKISNCLFYNNDGAGVVRASWQSTNTYVYNISIIDCKYGILLSRAANEIYAKNILAYSNSTADFGGTFYRTNCSSSDGTADDAGGTGNRINQTFTFVDESNDDFHLSSSDSGAKNQGTDLSGDGSYPITDDIDYQTRPYGGIWDIGADETPISSFKLNGGQMKIRGKVKFE